MTYGTFLSDSFDATLLTHNKLAELAYVILARQFGNDGKMLRNE